MPDGSTPARPVTPAGILAARLGHLVERVEMDGTDPGLAQELRLVWELAAGLDPYIERCTTPESASLRSLTEVTRAEDWSRYGDDGRVMEQEMLSGHVEGQALQMLVHALGARRILEIGMFTGYSALAMAEALPADGRLVACEIDAEVAALARRSFEQSPAGARIDVRVGPAAQTLAALAGAGECFDLVFVDADKAGYRGYVRTVLDGGLLADRGLICVDNTLMQGQPWTGVRSANGEAIAAFNAALAADPDVVQVLLPLRDGLTLIRRVTPTGTG